MIIIVSPIQLFLGLCVVGAAAFGLGVRVGLRVDVARDVENKPR